MDIYSCINTSTLKERKTNTRTMMPSTDSTSSIDSYYIDGNSNDEEDDTMVMFTKNSIYSYSTDPKFEKYIGKHKYYAYVLLRIFNPFQKIKLIESTLSNILNIFILKPKKDEEKEKQNSIYIFYNINSNLVTKIKYIGICSLDEDEGRIFYTDNQKLLNTKPLS